MVLANAAAKAGDWNKAVDRFRAMPRDGVMQLLQPLLLAWASQGAGDTDQALATLRPLLENPRYRPIVALHAGMIADIGERPVEAAAFYQQAEGGWASESPRTALILASWHARSGQLAEAEGILGRMAESGAGRVDRFAGHDRQPGPAARRPRDSTAWRKPTRRSPPPCAPSRPASSR